MSDNPLTGLVLVIVLGIAAQWIAWRIKLPSILLLLSFGILAGPVLGWLKPDALLGDVLLPIVTIAVGLILFEGGLSLKFSELQQISRPLLGILTVGAAVTWGGTAVLAHTILGFSWSMSILAGAILIVSGPTVVGPILLQVRPNKKVASIARWEGIVIDPIGVILAVIVFEVIRAILTHEPLSGAAWALAKAIGVGIGLGMAGAALLVQLLRRYWVPDHLQNAFVVAFVTAVLFGANAIQHEAGILAVTLMGIFVANQKAVSVRHIVEFKENLRVLLIAGIFILLAARLESDALTVFGGKAPLFLAALILVVRPLAVFLSTWGSDLKRNEKLFLSWLAPRGIVAAAMGSVLAIQLERAEHPEARLLVPIIFWVIIGTVFVYGLTVDRVAKQLGIAHKNPQGVLFIGAHAWARELASVIAEAGFAVLLIDSNRSNVKTARMAGLPAWRGNVLSEDAVEHLDLYGIGKLLALTANDEINALAALHFREVFPRNMVYQPGVGDESSDRFGLPRHLTGRTAFGRSWSDLASRFSRGHRGRVTTLSDTFPWESFKLHYKDSAIPLFLISAGRLRVFTVEEPPVPKSGDKVISLAKDPEAPEAAEKVSKAAKSSNDKTDIPGPKPGMGQDEKPPEAKKT